MKKTTIILGRDKDDYEAIRKKIRKKTKEEPELESLQVKDLKLEFRFFKELKLIPMYCSDKTKVDPDGYLIDDESDEVQLDLIMKIVTEITTKGKIKDVAIFAIHWGGLDETLNENRTDELNDLLENENFKMAWYSVNAGHDKLGLDKLEELFEKQIENKKKRILKLMEGVLIIKFEKYLESVKRQGQAEPISITKEDFMNDNLNDFKILFKRATWLRKQDKQFEDLIGICEKNNEQEICIKKSLVDFRRALTEYHNKPEYDN